MRKSILTISIACLVGCTAQQPYRDATNSGRSVTVMEIDAAICQTVLPNQPPKKAPSLCPACDLIDATVTKVKRQRIFDNCMRTRGWEAAR